MTATATSTSLGADFDPWADEYFEDPVTVYDRMRETEPVHWNAHRGIWFLSSYDDVMKVLKDRKHFSAAQFQAERPHMERSKKEQHREFAGGTILTTEPPDHTRLRRPVDPDFSPKSMRGFESTIDAVADRLLDAVGDRAEWDVIAHFAYPLPVLAIAALLGISEDDEKELMSFVRADDALLAIDPRAEQSTLDHYASMGSGIEKFVARVVAKKRAEPPGDDLMSVLFREEAAGRYSTGEVLATVHLMIEAGHVTTINLIGNGVNLLLEDRTRFQRLVEDPSLARTAVDECNRLDGPVHFAGRIAIADLTLHGQKISKSDVVICLFPAANRDPEQFPDPTEFVIDRSPNKPTNFGAGIHHCIGVNLAKAEAAVAFRKLAQRFPNLTLSKPPVRQRTFELRGFRQIIVKSNHANG